MSENNDVQSKRTHVRHRVESGGTPMIQSRRPTAGDASKVLSTNQPFKSPIASKRPSAHDSPLDSDIQSKRRANSTGASPMLDLLESKDFDHKKTRKHKKGVVNFETNEPPTKFNNYHNARMSQILRDYRGNTTTDMITDDKEFEDEDENAVQRLLIESREKKIGPRVYLATTAVVFLWASSIAACRGYVFLFIPFPRYNQLSGSISALSASAKDERVGYFDCVQEVLDECNFKYGNQVLEEGARLTGVQNSNAAIIGNAYNIRDNCRADFAKALDVLEIIVGFQSLDFQANIDGADECQPVQDTFQAQLASVEAMDAADDISADSLNVVSDYEKQFEEREEYETNYHENITTSLEQRPDPLTEEMHDSVQLRLDLQEGISKLQACIKVESFIIDEFGNRVDCPPESQVAARAQDIIDAYVAKYERFRVLIDNFIQSIEDLIDIADIIIGFIKFLRFIGIKNLDFTTPSLGDLINAPGFDALGIDISEITNFLDARFAELTTALDFASLDLDVAIASINAGAVSFAAELRGEFELPGLSVDTLSLIRLAIQGALDLPQLISDDLLTINTDIDFFEVETPFEAIVISTDIDFLSGFGDRSISFFSYPDGFFVDLDFNITNFLAWIITLDVLIRICQSILLWRKYFKQTEYSTPPANVTSEKGTLFKEKKNTLQKVVDIVYSGLFTMIYTLFAVLVVSLLFYLAYTPLYQEFVDGCVRNDVDSINVGNSDGTMLFRNLDTMAAGFAASSGDRAITQDVDKFNIDREVACSGTLQNSVTVRQDHFETHEDLRKSIDRLRAEYILFGDCVSWDLVDEKVNTDTAVIDDLNDNDVVIDFSFNDIFQNQTCKNPIEEIDVTVNALHDCSAIDSCQATEPCNGPNFANLQRLSHNTACTTEFALHSYLLASLFAVTMFTCLNFARYYLMKGILQVWFEYFTPDMYSYLVSCTEAGTILPPKKVQDGKAGFIELRRRSLDHVLAKFKRKGYRNLFFAVAINLPWMVFLVLFTRDLEFNEN